ELVDLLVQRHFEPLGELEGVVEVEGGSELAGLDGGLDGVGVVEVAAFADEGDPGDHVHVLPYGPAVDEDLAGGRLAEGREEAEQGGLAGAVAAEEAVDLAGLEGEGDVGEGFGVAVFQRHVPQADGEAHFRAPSWVLR